ncbi:hypothetical protein B0T26DRAFT_794513 [Lasiosphaeria miniovina]|uniref:Uncharacterized protein n=1 Tax=Lasiosphaeria miniovina TaxID=1954250 RepID=A0AA40DL83_9PEZI|nr:uncharacterized protein B0T26DRAFT_794513 [Lasiosphaeria miniovina]KAK0703953.1 hypothetical protein B0T26DRAFT_794513 [Lasiosphaeria miniovina]
MSWEDDDLGVDAEIKPLMSIFGALYHYDTKTWKIPSRRPAIELSRKIATLIDNFGKEGNLIILYYAGHARPNEQAGGSPVWTARRHRESPTVPSSVIHSLLAEVDCDVLLLYDCCHAIQAGEPSAGKGAVETLAACGFESIAAEVGSHSFTSSLVHELARAAHTQEWLSVVGLHRKIINRLQAWMPRVCFTDNSYSMVQMDRQTGQPIFETQRRRTPIYCFLSKQPRTIILTPLLPSRFNQEQQPFILLNPVLDSPRVAESSNMIGSSQPGDESKLPGSSNHYPKQKSKRHFWPEIFNSDRWAVYSTELGNYCLEISGLQTDSTSTKAEKILKAFTEDVGEPSQRYICDEIQRFCSPAIFEKLIEGKGELSSQLVAILDERSQEEESEAKILFLGRQQLLDVLLRKEISSHSTKTPERVQRTSPRRRVLYITNLDPWCTLAIAAAAPSNQVPFLRDFVYKHITFQQGMGVKLKSSGFQSFQLSFHLTCFAWRANGIRSFDDRLGADKRPLRNGKNVSYLYGSAVGPDIYIYEVQTSCMVTGMDNRFWTAYGFFDTYHDGGESKHDLSFYEPAEGEINTDPLTGGRYASDSPIRTAREYFLRVMESCVNDAKDEWLNVGHSLLRTIKPYVSVKLWTFGPAFDMRRIANSSRPATPWMPTGAKSRGYPTKSFSFLKS